MHPSGCTALDFSQEKDFPQSNVLLRAAGGASLWSVISALLGVIFRREAVVCSMELSFTWPAEQCCQNILRGQEKSNFKISTYSSKEKADV
jgi:hypothetical protein